MKEYDELKKELEEKLKCGLLLNLIKKPQSFKARPR